MKAKKTDYLRNQDSEFYLLNCFLSKFAKSKPIDFRKKELDIKGIIRLYSVLEFCDSCMDAIIQVSTWAPKITFVLRTKNNTNTIRIRDGKMVEKSENNVETEV